ncbi:MAG: lipocalin-like domain-containing protein [Pseudomonadota bacterium]
MKRAWLFFWLVSVGELTRAEDAYQLLRSDPAGFSLVVPGREFSFPADHLPHKDFRIEWWYLTANLQTPGGDAYGVHWTLFRQSMSPAPDPGGWASNQVWMAHAALSTPAGHVYQERFARGGIGQAGVTLDQAGRFVAWMDDWVLEGTGASPLPGQLEFNVHGHQVTLRMDSDTPWVLQGNQGYSQKSHLGQASYYYSQPHINIVGEVFKDGQTSKLQGQGWLDREWSSQPLAPDQPGWDWLSVHLDDGHALMVYRLRQEGGPDWISGSWVGPDGISTTLGSADIQFEPLAVTRLETAGGVQRDLPLRWRVVLPAQDLRIEIAADDVDHWLDTAFPYWEGPVTVAGNRTGRGYLELTGY